MNKKKKELVIIGVSLVVLLLITLGITYAFFMYSKEGSTLNTIQTGNLSFVYQEKDSGITLSDATPISDEEGKLLSGANHVFDFSIISSSMIENIHYEIYATVENGSTLPSRAVKTYLTQVDEGTKEETPVLDPLNSRDTNIYSTLGDSKVPGQINGKTLYQETINAKSPYYKKDFRFRMWITSDDANVIDGHWTHEGKSFSVRINVYAGDATIGTPENPDTLEFEDMSGANKPVLAQGMIPVVYSKKENAWVKQELEKSYAYQDQIWANAVTVKENGLQTREYYMSAPVGSVISMNDINTMWVWIPRYEYDTSNLGTNYAGGTQEQPGEINISFLNGITSTPSDSKHKIHPAFTFGDVQLKGLWYAKFETSTTDATCNSSPSDANCNKLMTSLQVKPSVASWRFASVSTMFRSVRNIQLQYASTYGFSKTDSDIHMSKNSEWGAVAYLSQSKYGKYGNSNYIGIEKEVRNNNCIRMITGIGANTRNETESTTTCTTNTYETANGQAASATGNITGVYDMSGGSWDFVMSVLADSNGKPMSGSNLTSNSGFNGKVSSGENYTSGINFPDVKYYDLYIGTNEAAACNNGICFGHALSETWRWYSDLTRFPSLELPWNSRGGRYYDQYNAGVYDAFIMTGGPHEFTSTRVVLCPL